MKKALFIILFSAISSITMSQLVRKDIKVPDILDYRTLKCDFHIHTVFSDGNVWPTVRVDEAWSMGLDVISITDHIEYQPHKEYIPVQHNAGYEIAKPKGDRQDLLVIHGTEITRVMPPGHLNAIFIEDGSKIETSNIEHMHASDTRSNFLDSIDHQHQDYMIALEEAHAQGGFLFWNHPGWSSQAPDGIKMYKVHEELIQKGWLKGIEVANSSEWYPEAFQWCLDYNLTMLSNSDIHATEEIFEKATKVEHRPITLVFATSKSENAVKDALENGRTAVWFNNSVIGREEYLKPLFYNSIIVSDAFYTDEKQRSYHNLTNSSDFLLKMEDIDSGEKYELLPQSTIVLQFDEVRDSRNLIIRNFMIEPQKSMEIRLEVK